MKFKTIAITWSPMLYARCSDGPEMEISEKEIADAQVNGSWRSRALVSLYLLTDRTSEGATRNYGTPVKSTVSVFFDDFSAAFPSLAKDAWERHLKASSGPDPDHGSCS